MEEEQLKLYGGWQSMGLLSVASVYVQLYIYLYFKNGIMRVNKFQLSESINK